MAGAYEVGETYVCDNGEVEVVFADGTVMVYEPSVDQLDVSPAQAPNRKQIAVERLAAALEAVEPHRD